MIPPLNAKRAQFFFSDKRQEWSETYWQSPSTDLDTTMLQAETLANIRTQCLAQGVSLTEIRVSDDSVFRDSDVDTSYAEFGRPAGASPTKQIYNLALLNEFQLLDGTPLDSNNAAQPQYCLRLRQEGDPGTGPKKRHRRVVYFSGFPKGNLVDQGNAPPWRGKAMGLAYQAFVDQLVDPARGWGFVVFQNPPVSGNLKVLNITRDNTTGICTVTYDGAIGIPPGVTIELYRPKFFGGSLKIQGKYEVKTSFAGQITFVDLRPGQVQYQSGGTLWVVTRDWVKINTVSGDGFAIRKRGGAEFAFRGRSRTRKNYAG